MAAKRTFQMIVVFAMLVSAFVSTGGALAKSGGCASYITVQWGDTLSGLAATCGATIEAIQTANPGLGWWLYAGQVLYIPTGYAPTPVSYPTSQTSASYIVQWGDTLGSIAISKGITLSSLLAVNPQIWNASLIYPGQAINLPAYVTPITYPPVSNLPISDTSQYGTLIITYGDGMLVRMGPSKDYGILQSPLIPSLFNSTWQYRKNSLTKDSKGLLWVEITLNATVNGYSTGWLLVKDTIGNYFTSPRMDPY